MLDDRSWQLEYTPDDGDLVKCFYVPALEDAERYDRLTGYFNAGALALAARGIEGLVRNGGRMRLVVGCTLHPPEIEAIETGEALREQIEKHLSDLPLAPPDAGVADALELLAWMVARGHLDVKVAVPCDPDGKPIHDSAIFHEKTGIVEDRAGNRLAWTGTRELLRRYFKAGMLSTPIAERRVEDRFLDMTVAERALYNAVEAYIANTYNKASGAERSAVGFVMTIYRRRLASSFAALRSTFENRLDVMACREQAQLASLDEDLPDDEAADEIPDADETAAMERQALAFEERVEIANLLERVRVLPPDGKLASLKAVLAELRRESYGQTMVFTQYTATMDFLREALLEEGNLRLMCFSGRGGEIPSAGGASWRRIGRDDAKRRFREGEADVLLRTDAAAEGLNFQFCGALVNYDMPWNPMRVEQRIGRIDRLGQTHSTLRIVNLHYEGTVETDVYRALRERIGLFESVVGRLQPILAQLPRTISEAVLSGGDRESADRANVVAEIEGRTREAEARGFDIDAALDEDLAMPARAPSPVTMDDLDRVIEMPDLMPPGADVQPLGHREYGLLAPGMGERLRVTTDPAYFEDHAQSVELWSPGSPLFHAPELLAPVEESPAGTTLKDILERYASFNQVLGLQESIEDGGSASAR